MGGSVNRGGSVTRALERSGSVGRALAGAGRKVLGFGGKSNKDEPQQEFEFETANVPTGAEPRHGRDDDDDVNQGPRSGMDDDDNEDVGRSNLFASLGADSSRKGDNEDEDDDNKDDFCPSESDDEMDIDDSAPVFSSAATVAADDRFVQMINACQATPPAKGRLALTEAAFAAALARRPLLAARLFMCWRLGHSQRATDLALMAGTQHLALSASCAALKARAEATATQRDNTAAVSAASGGNDKTHLRAAQAAAAAAERAVAAARESAVALVDAEKELASANANMAKALANVSAAAAAAGGDTRNRGANAVTATPTVSLRRLKAARAEAEMGPKGAFGPHAVTLRRRENNAKAHYAHVGLALASCETVLACTLLRMREREQYPGPLRAIRLLPRLERGGIRVPTPPPPPPAPEPKQEVSAQPSLGSPARPVEESVEEVGAAEKKSPPVKRRPPPAKPGHRARKPPAKTEYNDDEETKDEREVHEENDPSEENVEAALVSRSRNRTPDPEPEPGLRGTIASTESSVYVSQDLSGVPGTSSTVGPKRAAPTPIGRRTNKSIVQAKVEATHNRNSPTKALPPRKPARPPPAKPKMAAKALSSAEAPTAPSNGARSGKMPRGGNDDEDASGDDDDSSSLSSSSSDEEEDESDDDSSSASSTSSSSSSNNSSDESGDDEEEEKEEEEADKKHNLSPDDFESSSLEEQQQTSGEDASTVNDADVNPTFAPVVAETETPSAASVVVTDDTGTSL